MYEAPDAFARAKSQYLMGPTVNQQSRLAVDMCLAAPAEFSGEDEAWLQRELDALCVPENFRQEEISSPNELILTLMRLYLRHDRANVPREARARAVRFCAGTLTKLVYATARHQNPPLCSMHCLLLIHTLEGLQDPLLYWEARAELRKFFKSIITLLLPFRGKGLKYGDGQLDLVEAAAMCVLAFRDSSLSGMLSLAATYSNMTPPTSPESSSPTYVTDRLRAGTVNERLHFVLYRLCDEKGGEGWLHSNIRKLKRAKK